MRLEIILLIIVTAVLFLVIVVPTLIQSKKTKKSFWYCLRADLVRCHYCKELDEKEKMELEITWGSPYAGDDSEGYYYHKTCKENE